MKRIKLAARQIGAKWYQGWTIDPWDAELAVMRNRAWILRKMEEGYEIIDIGIDPTRDFRSPFYEMEKRMLIGHNYPIIPYQEVVERG
jgi:hypothetical protein